MGCNCGGSKQWTPPAETSAGTETKVRGAASPDYFAPKKRPVWNGPKPRQDT